MEKKDIILSAQNISKQYRLGEVGTGTLSHDLNRWWYKIRGKENSYLTLAVAITVVPRKNISIFGLSNTLI